MYNYDTVAGGGDFHQHDNNVSPESIITTNHTTPSTTKQPLPQQQGIMNANTPLLNGCNFSMMANYLNAFNNNNNASLQKNIKRRYEYSLL